MRRTVLSQFSVTLAWNIHDPYLDYEQSDGNPLKLHDRILIPLEANLEAFGLVKIEYEFPCLVQLCSLLSLPPPPTAATHHHHLLPPATTTPTNIVNW
ncbi:hypothetical protein L2E82_12070 [Cichorium intybus]|uniref:Uncharacterized protein n=1 Tax=Cichorium intybus TaxID=13427 RepID=A0ACB9GFT0_CICIN|nr:hypothetical protein L2E82_12070 [Cichorium intybus]